MAALTADKLNRRIENPDGGYVQTMNVNASTTIYEGGACFLDTATGCVTKTYNIAHPFIGIADNGYANTAIAATTTKPLKVRYGHIEQVPLAGAATTAIGQLIYVTTDNDYTLTAASGMLVGRVYDLGTAAGYVRVDFQRYFGLVAMA